MQGQHPLAAQDSDMNVVDIRLNGQTIFDDQFKFNGLSISSSFNKTLLDAVVGPNWLYSVGYIVPWEIGGGGQPTFNNSMGASLTEMFFLEFDECFSQHPSVLSAEHKCDKWR